ncbi:MAG TPA: DUF4097 family beta strand repeat-containing protein [Steroidobacteraceae bacterium]|jgi:DUF4097 and DUF4098 domain-containing protein YvlB|nr:DUF4097 family beta strand repeat-containing protein [Steroidobacteraceae bacterium]
MNVSGIRSLRALCVLGLLPLAAAAGESSVDRKVAADPKGEVVISNVSGSVDVRGWDRNEVQVKGELDEDVDRVDVETSGGRTFIKVILPRGGHHGGDAVLEIQVPRMSSLDVTTTSADVNSKGVLGNQQLKTVSGEIVADIGGDDNEVRSVSGDLTLRGTGKPQNIRVSSVSGSLELNNAAGKLDVVTVSGDARARLGDTTEINARTTSGDMELHARMLRDGRVSAESVSGDVTLSLQSAEGLGLEIESFSGEITGCLATDVQRVSKYGPGVRLDTRTGRDGSARVRAKTLSGDIEICDR